jgi:lysine 6-dehydrogenase
VTRIVVLGAGIVGRAAAWDLQRRGHRVVVADSDDRSAASLAAELDVEWQRADAAQPDSLGPLLRSADLVVSAVPYRLGLGVATAAVEAGTHYLDFGGNPTVVTAQLGLDEAARSAGVSVIPDCGLAPGIADVLAEADIAALGPGPVDRVALRVGALPVEPVGALGYQLAFSPEGLVNEYAEPCEVLREGSLTTVEPLTEFEELDWEQWGPLEAFHTAGGSSSLARRWEGRVAHLDYKTLRYPGHGRAFRALFELGMFDETPRDYGPALVSRRAVLLEALGSLLPSGAPDVVLVRTSAETTRSGTRRTSGHQLVDRHDGRFSALARTTAFPATGLAHLLLHGGIDVAGARTMDNAVTADRLLPELAPVGIVPDPWAP